MENIPKFYRFHMTGCGHCVDMEEAWKDMTNKIKNKYKNKVIVKDINAIEKDKYEGGKTVNSFPTMVYVLNGKVEKYEGGRSEQDLVNWVESKMQKKVQQGGKTRKHNRKKTNKQKKQTAKSKKAKSKKAKSKKARK